MLTEAQIAARKGKLTASRVGCLMRADAKAINQLWLEMTGQAEPEELDHLWPVYFGSETEAMHIEWVHRYHGTVSRRGEPVQHPRFPWALATLDGWFDPEDGPLECKAIGGWEPFDTVVERYQPQLQWQMECTGAERCALSVIISGRKPVMEVIERDQDYIGEMLRRGVYFMECVLELRPPLILDPVSIPPDPTRAVDMTGNNTWAATATTWRETMSAAAQHDAAQDELKAMVPEDAKRCFGHGVVITRNRAGSLYVREDAT